MGKLVLAFAALSMVAFWAGTASADCVNDIQEARKQVNQMPDGPAKRVARNELRLAEAAVSRGDDDICLVHIGVCAQLISR